MRSRPRSTPPGPKGFQPRTQSTTCAVSYDRRRLVARLGATSALRLYPFDETRRDEYVRLAATLRMRAPDVLYVALALELGVPLISWDRQQREGAATLVKVMTPVEALARGL